MPGVHRRQAPLDERVGKSAEEQPGAVAAPVAPVVGQRTTRPARARYVRLVATDREAPGRRQHSAVRTARDDDSPRLPTATIADDHRYRGRRGPDSLQVRGQREQAIDWHVVIRRLVPGMAEPGKDETRGLLSACPRCRTEQVRGHDDPDGRRTRAQPEPAQILIADAWIRRPARTISALATSRPSAARPWPGSGHRQLIACCGPTHASRARPPIAAGGRIDLDDLRPEITEQHAGDGTGQPGGEVEHPDAAESSARLRWLRIQGRQLSPNCLRTARNPSPVAARMRSTSRSV